MTSCKPYQCNCGKLFKKKSSLTAHASTHSTAAYACECGAIFRCEQYLKNHRRRKHQDQSLQNESPATKIPRFSSLTEAIQGEADYLVTENQYSSLTPMDFLKMQMQEV